MNEVGFTNIESCIVFTGKIIKVGDAQRLNGSLSNSTKKVPQENINPHGRAGINFAFLKGKQIGLKIRSLSKLNIYSAFLPIVLKLG